MSTLRSALCCALLFPLLLRAEVVLNGWIVHEGQPLAVLRDSNTRVTSPWLKIGQSWHGHRLVAIDTVRGAATLESDGRTAKTPQLNTVEEEYLIRVQARPPAGFASKSYEALVLKTADISYRVDWTPGALQRPVVLQPDRTYEFAIAERVASGPQGIRAWYELAQVKEAGRVLYDRDVCELHGERLTQTFVVLQYGLMRWDWGDLRKRYFPHSLSGRGTAGCVETPGMPATALFRACTPCEAAFQQREQAGLNARGR